MNRFPRITMPVGAVDCVKQENSVGPDDDDDDSDDDGKVALLVVAEES